MTDINIITPFSYEGLSATEAAELQAVTARIKDRLTRQVKDIIATGHDLIEVKSKLPHGQFGRWLAQEFGMTDRYMRSGGDIREMLRVVLRRNRMAKATPKLKRPLHLSVSAIRALMGEVSNPRYLLGWLHSVGHLPFAWPMPNGYKSHWEEFAVPADISKATCWRSIHIEFKATASGRCGGSVVTSLPNRRR